jgi:hypothetical protein
MQSPELGAGMRSVLGGRDSPIGRPRERRLPSEARRRYALLEVDTFKLTERRVAPRLSKRDEPAHLLKWTVRGGAFVEPAV